MITFYRLTHRFKRSLLEITSDSQYVYYWNPDPLSKEKLPDNIVFEIAAGKKAYDIIRRYEDCGHFFSQKVIDILSKFVDMSDKSYPIKIKGLDEQYYVIYNLEAYPYWNKDEDTFMHDPRYFGMQAPSTPIFGIEGTLLIMVSEEVKNALLKNKVSNIELVESFGCSLDEYEKIKNSKVKPEVHVYCDK